LFIVIEQSIKNAAFSVVFKPNVPLTWSVVKASISNFLTSLWRQGALVGATPSEAFEVGCGLGETMSQNDVNEGIMRIQVKAAPSRPAEFIVISFEQKMGTEG
jgi:phage tail sheath protein FI